MSVTDTEPSFLDDSRIGKPVDANALFDMEAVDANHVTAHSRSGPACT
ncbi:MAG: hypothetical protein HYV02_08100 [Deltaproteobacteria bacterium]|nr:hypothetical protein [Deltaproteobacteria bacterium]